MEINAIDFPTRKDLDQYIERKIGKDVKENFNGDTIIKGTERELNRLMLNEKTTVYGVRCELITKQNEALTPQELRDKHFLIKYGETKDSSKGKGSKKKNTKGNK